MTLFGAEKTNTLTGTLSINTNKQTKTKTVPHGNTDENLLYMTIYISFVMQSVSFLVLYQTFPYIGSSGSQYDINNTDFRLKMKY